MTVSTARNTVTGRVVSGDEAALLRLGSPWQVESEKSEPKATRKGTTRKSSGETSDEK